jgi:hypothetical protein
MPQSSGDEANQYDVNPFAIPFFLRPVIASRLHVNLSLS